SLRRCSSVRDRFGYALSSRLGETKNRQQRGMAEYLKRLLGTWDRCVVFAAKVCLDRDVNQLLVPAYQRAIGMAALWLVRDAREPRRIFPDADLPHLLSGVHGIVVP